MDYTPVFWDIETTGLNPLAQDWYDNQMGAQVTAVGIGHITNLDDCTGKDDAEVDVQVMAGSDEYTLLERLAETLREHDYEREPILVGYNSRQFDHGYIGARYSRYRLDGRPFVCGWRRLDMMRVARDDPAIPKTYPKEGEYAEALDVHVPDEYDGSDMPDAFKNGEWDKIESHVEADVEESALMFAERQERMMEHFYDHYDINADTVQVEEVEIHQVPGDE